MMRDDEHPPDSAEPRPGTLPPSGKVTREIFSGLERLGKELGLPVLCLLAGHWGLLSPEKAGDAFVSALSFVLGGYYALRRGDQPR